MIRAAHSDDIASVIALQARVERDDEIWGYGADSERVWSERRFDWSFVAIVDGQIVGFIYCVPRAASGESVFPSDSKILEIGELVVAAEHRDHGLGRELVAMARARARRDGFSHLRVHTASKRFDDTLRFYRSCGFTPWFVELTSPT